MTSQSVSRLARGALVLLLIGLCLIGVRSDAAGAACTPRVTMALERSTATPGFVGYDVTLTAAASVPGGNQLVKVRFTEARSAQVTVGSASQPVPSVVLLPAGTTSWSFRVRQTEANAPFLVSFVVTDLCGDAPKFVGAGSAAARVDPTPTSTVSTPTPTRTPTPTATATPTASVPDCSTRLQQRIDAASAGATLIVPACTYRESVVISRPLTLVGTPGAEIRGSDVWTTWTRAGSYWIAAGVPSFTGNGFCRAEVGDRCRRREQVFVDGQPLVQVAANPTPGQFAVIGGTVFLADDPAGHTVEVSTRAAWVRADAADVTVRGFTMRHAATDAQKGGISNGGFSRLTVQQNVLLDAHGAAISLEGGSGHRVIANQIERSGQEGIHITGVSDVLVQSNTIAGSNTEGFDPDWESGGLKATESTHLTLDSNDVRQNDGPGLWCDLNCTSVVMTGNRLSFNQRAGILFELSDGAQIIGNAAWENGWGLPSWGWGGGIVVSTSKNATVSHNTLAWNADGISVLEQDREPDLAVTGVTVSENVIALAPPIGGSYALAWLSDVSPSHLYAPVATNSGAANAYWTPLPDSGAVQFGWTDDHGLLGDFNATPGEESGRYLTLGEKNQALGAATIPLTPVAR